MQIGQLHAYSKLLYEHLIAAKPGTIVTYDDLSVIIKHDVRSEARHYLTRARRLALKRDGIVFDVARDVGVIRVENGGVVDVGQSYVPRIRCAARRGNEVLSTIELASLSKSDVTRALTTRAQLGIVHSFTGTRTERQLSKMAERGSLPSAATAAKAGLVAFGKH